MISVEEALAIMKSAAGDFGQEKIPLSQALGRVNKDVWKVDRALPPYDRVTMDGIAINYSAYAEGNRSFPIQGVAAAGQAQQSLNDPTHCLEIMTGAVMAEKADTVIRYEDLKIENGVAHLQVDGVVQGQNIHYQGEDRKAGEEVLQINRPIRSVEIGLGASIGKAEVTVAALPKVIVISTGDELVSINNTPLPHQIRRSNVYRIQTVLRGLGIDAKEDHLADDKAIIKTKLQDYLNSYDVVILSGGVSKGKFDFLPEVLAELGAEKKFHKIAQRPGKPFWFGDYKGRCKIFALPGNPVSSFMCMQRYFKYWLAYSLQGKVPDLEYVVLQSNVIFNPDLTYFLEVSLSSDKTGKLLATPHKGNGSGDFANLLLADGFIVLPRGRNEFIAGEVFPILRW